MTAAAPDVFDALLAAIEAELAALAAEDADAILAATAAKADAVDAVASAVAAGLPLRRDVLERARDLNADAIVRARAKILGVERRLASLLPAARPQALTYGRDGRWAAP
ncbi:MAG: hypothetical protein WCO82_11505 [Sphingomonadales bacterium]|jgi:nucleotide-binding universal stress UspA family protein